MSLQWVPDETKKFTEQHQSNTKNGAVLPVSPLF